jgi:glycosyltransferase involved in cell wall biosynthesis
METSPLRIALISDHASPLAVLGGVDAGGQNVYVAEIGRCLARRGHHVDVLTRCDDPSRRGGVDIRPGLRVLHMAAGPAHFVPKEQLLPHMAEFTRQAHRLMVHSRRYDVLHANFFMSGLVGLTLKRCLRLPLVTTFHALGLVRRLHQREVDGFPLERLSIERQLVHQSDRVIAECPQDAKDLQSLYGAAPSNIATVPCGVDVERFRPMRKSDARARLGLRADAFVVLQLGRLVPRKGIDNVIRAVARLPDDIDVRLVVVGGASAEPDERLTPEIGRLRSVAEHSGAAQRVRFMGSRHGAQLRAWYAAADVFVTTPWYEPFGITPLEAMACGTPVVGSRVGGIQHSVVEGETGFLVPPNDPDALAQRLELLYRQPLLARSMGARGVQRVRSTFTWERVTDDLLRVYAAVRPDCPWTGAAPAAGPRPPQGRDEPVARRGTAL